MPRLMGTFASVDAVARSGSRPTNRVASRAATTSGSSAGTSPPGRSPMISIATDSGRVPAARRAFSDRFCARDRRAYLACRPDRGPLRKRSASRARTTASSGIALTEMPPPIRPTPSVVRGSAGTAMRTDRGDGRSGGVHGIGDAVGGPAVAARRRGMSRDSGVSAGRGGRRARRRRHRAPRRPRCAAPRRRRTRVPRAGRPALPLQSLRRNRSAHPCAGAQPSICSASASIAARPRPLSLMPGPASRGPSRPDAKCRPAREYGVEVRAHDDGRPVQRARPPPDHVTGGIRADILQGPTHQTAERSTRRARPLHPSAPGSRTPRSGTARSRRRGRPVARAPKRARRGLGRRVTE